MFYILFHLDHEKQLYALNPEIIHLIKVQAKELLRQAGGSLMASKSNFYRFDPLFKDTQISLINTTNRLNDLFKSKKDDLLGYSIFLIKSDSPDQARRRLDNISLLIEEDNSIWLDRESYPFFKDYLAEYSNKDLDSPILPLKLREEKLMGLEDIYKEFIQRQDILESIKGALSHWIFNKEGQNTFFVQDNTPCEDTLNLISNAFNDSRSLITTLLTFRGFNSPLDPYAPLYEGVNQKFLDQVPLFLDIKDQKSWTDKKHILFKLKEKDWFFSSIDHFFDEFQEVYFLYWKACLKKIDSGYKIPLLLIYEPERLSSASLDIFVKFINNLALKYPSLKTLILSSSLKEIRDSHFSFNKFSSFIVSPPSSEVVSAKIKKICHCSFTNKESQKLLNFEDRALSGVFFRILMENPLKKKNKLKSRLVYLFQNNTIIQEILYICYLGQNFSDREFIIQFFSNYRVSESVVIEHLKRLEKLGFIKFMHGTHSLWICPIDFLQLKNKLDSQRLEKEFALFVEQSLNKVCFSSQVGLFSFLSQYGDIGQALTLLSQILNNLIDLREFDMVNNFFLNDFFQKRELTESELEGFHNVRCAAQLRALLLEKGVSGVDAILKGESLNSNDSKGLFSQELDLQQAFYFSLQGDSKIALERVKKSLFVFQQVSDHFGEVRANYSLGLIMLSKREIQKSLDHFDIALRIGSAIGAKKCYYEIIKKKIVASFLFGNLTMASRLLQEKLSFFKENGMGHSLYFLLFLMGRINFDLGNYDQAFSSFKEARLQAYKYEDTKALRVIHSWMGRSLAYRKDSKKAIRFLERQGDSLENLYFLAEAYFFDNNLKLGAQILNKALRSNPIKVKYIHQSECWDDGYLLLEGHLFDKKHSENVLYDQAYGFSLYLKGLYGDTLGLKEDFEGLCQSDRAYHEQPYGYLFFYYYSNLIDQGKIDESPQKSSFLISQSSKLLQTRVGRFDNQKMKHDFLTENYWNLRIIKKAQTLNLI